MSIFNRFFKSHNLLMPIAEVNRHVKYSKLAFGFAGICSFAFVLTTKHDIKKQVQQNAVISNKCPRPVK